MARTPATPPPAILYGMATVHEDDKEFRGKTTFTGEVVWNNGDGEPVFSLENINSLDISGSVTAATSGSFGTNLAAGGDLTIGGDATIGGVLTTSEGANLGGNTVVSGNLSVDGDFTAGGNIQTQNILAYGAVQLASTLEVSDASALQGVTCTTIAASGNAAVGGTCTLASTLAVAGASTLHSTSVVGTLGVSGATTLAACNATTVTASTSLVVTGATIVGLHEHLTLDIASLVSGGVYGLPSPVAGTITKIRTRLKGALTTGNATLTPKIGATPVTDGVVTLVQVGSAAGQVDAPATPSAANVVAEGSDINFTVGGTNGAAVGATVVISIRRSA